jgi:hypothetical protein
LEKFKDEARVPHLIKGLMDIEKNSGGNKILVEAGGNEFGESIDLVDSGGVFCKAELFITEEGKW